MSYTNLGGETAGGLAVTSPRVALRGGGLRGNRSNPVVGGREGHAQSHRGFGDRGRPVVTMSISSRRCSAVYYCLRIHAWPWPGPGSTRWARCSGYDSSVPPRGRAGRTAADPGTRHPREGTSPTFAILQLTSSRITYMKQVVDNLDTDEREMAVSSSRGSSSDSYL